MSDDADNALAAIRQCVADDRFIVLAHFRQRMTERGLVWPDVLTVLDEPERVRPGRGDPCGRDKWLIRGTAADGLAIELVCVLDTDDNGELTLFITAYDPE